VTATAAYVYGFLPGVALVTVGWLASALLAYLLGRSVGQPVLSAVLAPSFLRVEQQIKRGGTPLLLSARLIPIVPLGLMGYAAGASGVKIWRFSWTTVVGYLPARTHKRYRQAGPAVWGAALLVALLLIAARLATIIRG
jgi:uncharacterized membrane protein YdjX (TVP38/TMEM64 family)